MTNYGTNPTTLIDISEFNGKLITLNVDSRNAHMLDMCWKLGHELELVDKATGEVMCLRCIGRASIDPVAKG